jgi:hypothetical protein
MFPEALVQDFDWQNWAAKVPARLKAPAADASMKEKIGWGLGEAPATGISPGGGHYGEQCEDGTVRVFRQDFALEDSIEMHVFALLEALPCVCPMAFLSGVHSSYRLTPQIASKH